MIAWGQALEAQNAKTADLPKRPAKSRGNNGDSIEDGHAAKKVKVEGADVKNSYEKGTLNKVCTSTLLQNWQNVELI